MKVFAHQLHGVIRRAVVHHDDLIKPVFQLKQRADSGLDRHTLVMRGYNDGNRDEIVVSKLIFQQIAPFGGVQLGRANGHRQEQKAGVADHIENEEKFHAQQEPLDRVSHTGAASLLAGCALAVCACCSKRRCSRR